MPNVLGVGGLQALVKSGLSVEGKRIVVAGSGPFLLAAAAYLRKQGAVIALIAEQASPSVLTGFARSLLRHPGKLLQGADLRLRLDEHVIWPDAGSPKWKQWRADVLSPCSGKAALAGTFDYVATGYGFRPNIELADFLGCESRGGSIKVNRHQQTTAPDIYACGECTGIGGVDLALLSGQMAGLAASGRPQPSPGCCGKTKHKASHFAERLNVSFALRQELRQLVRDDTVVCRCEDVPWGKVKGIGSRREAKLYTRCGMGPCQARICGPILDFLQVPDRDTARSPVFPARLETLLISEDMQRL